MPTAISRTQAKRRAIAAQGIAVIVFVGGVALGIAGLPDQTVATPTIIGTANAPANTQKTPNGQQNLNSATMSIHVGSLAQRLSMTDNAPEIPKVEPPVAIEDPAPTDNEDTGEIIKRLRYIGYVGESGSHAAFVRLDGTQRIVREGGTIQGQDEFLDDLTVKTIRPGYLIATDGERSVRIPLSKRSGKSITMANGNDITPATITDTRPDLEYNEAILGDPNRVPQHEINRRRRTLERALRGEQPRTEASRLKVPEGDRMIGIDARGKRKTKKDENE